MINREKAIIQVSDITMTKQVYSPGFKTIWQLCPLMDAFLYVTGLIAAVGAGIVRPLMAIVLGRLVNNFNGSSITPPQELRKRINHNVLYYIYLFLAEFGLTTIYSLMLSIAAARIVARLRLAYVRASIYQHVDEAAPGKVSVDLATNMDNLQDATSERFGQIVHAVSTVIASLVVGYMQSWRLASVLLSLVVTLFTALIGTMVVNSRIERQINRLQSEAAGLAEEAFSAVQLLEALDAKNKLLQKYSVYLEELRKQGQMKSPITGAQYALSYFILLSAYALAFWYGTKELLQRHIGNGGNVVMQVSRCSAPYKSAC